MSRRSTVSTSSTLTPDSWDDLAQLGEYILDQLGRDRRSENLLVHWVAHRLAEHMQTAETSSNTRERETARDAATLLIAQLWQARAGWPRGWPPDALREFTEGARQADNRSYSRESVRLPPWLSTLDEIEELHREERAAWVNAALLELGTDELRRTLEAAPDETPEPDDLSDIRRHLRAYEEAESWIFTHAEDGEDPSRRPDRAQILGRILEGIADRRAALVKQTIADARRGQKRKPSAQPGPVRRSRKRSGQGQS